MKFKRIAIDTSKHVFTLHGVDELDRAVLRRELKRIQVETFFGQQEATEVVLEASGGSHHWARVLGRLGHRVRLIPPQYVKPFVKRAKNDPNVAKAISEAASRPSMRSVAIKTIDQQADGIILKHREMLVGQRTQSSLINARRRPARCLARRASRTRNFHTCQGLRPRRAGGRALAMTRQPMLPSGNSTPSAPETFKLSRLNGWPICSPTDASPAPSRMPSHGSGPMWIATPSS
jgi:transposase